jgi:hypothetical protein
MRFLSPARHRDTSIAAGFADTCFPMANPRARLPKSLLELRQIDAGIPQGLIGFCRLREWGALINAPWPSGTFPAIAVELSSGQRGQKCHQGRPRLTRQLMRFALQVWA